MIYSILGTFLVLAAFCLGYWFGTQTHTTTVKRKRLEKEQVKSTEPLFDNSTPFSRILKNNSTEKQ